MNGRSFQLRSSFASLSLFFRLIMRETHRKNVRNKNNTTHKLLPKTFADDSNLHYFNDSQCLCLPCLMHWGILRKVLLQLLRSVFSSKFTVNESE